MSIFGLLQDQRERPRRQIAISEVQNGWLITNGKMETFISRDAEGVVEIVAKQIEAKVDVVRETEK